MTNNVRSALVLGATGGIGGETARALVRHGWRVIAMVRDSDRLEQIRSSGCLAGVELIAGDAMRAADVLNAARGVQAIIHAVNPPGYRNWGKLVLPMIDNSIAAARAANARLVLPGTIYNFGDDAFPVLKEDSPQNPKTEKGRLRFEMERRMEQASRDGVRSLIVRFGEFFGPASGSSWLSMGLVTPGKRISAVTQPATTGIGHAWAYLPDAGETIARLLDREAELEPFARFHFNGYWDADGMMMPDAIARALGRPDLKTKKLQWWLLRLAGIFQETPREVWKMRYLWQTPIRLDNGKLVEFLGEEPHTGLGEALATTLRAHKVS